MEFCKIGFSRLFMYTKSKMLLGKIANAYHKKNGGYLAYDGISMKILNQYFKHQVINYQVNGKR